jgi:hypothetical protein
MWHIELQCLAQFVQEKGKLLPRTRSLGKTLAAPANPRPTAKSVFGYHTLMGTT